MAQLWGARDEEEMQAALDAHAGERAERDRLYRIRRFLEAYPADGNLTFTYTQAEQLADKGADYHLAEQLAATGATPDQAIRILL